MIAALYVQPEGCYAGMANVDPWPESRDARTYAGPHPVVAHPPCQRWGQLGYVNWIRWGGEHNRPGNDGGCFAAALESVRRWGGVLEHPADTLAWVTFGLPRPSSIGWTSGWMPNEWVCEVWQSAYGHKANKRTWLFYAGSNPPADANWSRPRGSHQVGQADQRGPAGNKPVLSKAESNATPRGFRDYLLGLALNSRQLTLADA